MLSLFFIWQGLAQVISDLDWISPMHEGLAAVKKGDMWGFIDKDGVINVDLRADLVAWKSASDPDSGDSDMTYPAFVEGRCLIEETIDGIRYFGFIDPQGKTVVEPGYINATNFRNGYAIVTQYSKEVLGKNELLGKDVVNYIVEEYIIDMDGKVVATLGNARTYVPKKAKGSSPDMYAYFLGDRLVAVKGENGKWSVFQF